MKPYRKDSLCPDCGERPKKKGGYCGPCKNKRNRSYVLRDLGSPEAVTAYYRHYKRLSDARIRAANPLSDRWEVTAPDRQTYRARSLKSFCKDHDLSYDMMRHVSRGTYPDWRGWRLKKLS